MTTSSSLRPLASAAAATFPLVSEIVVELHVVSGSAAAATLAAHTLIPGTLVGASRGAAPADDLGRASRAPIDALALMPEYSLGRLAVGRLIEIAADASARLDAHAAFVSLNRDARALVALGAAAARGMLPAPRSAPIELRPLSDRLSVRLLRLLAPQ